jgi:hypothetical protein
VKLHTLIDLRGPIPTMIAISDGKQADVRVLDDIVPEPSINRLESRVVDKSTGLRSDHIVWLTLEKSVQHYPDRLWRVSYRDPEDGKVLVFLTNHFDLPALTIAQLYKCRWQVELFFKWIKQNLRIKHFFGNSANAVKTQVWIAVCVRFSITTAGNPTT